MPNLLFVMTPGMSLSAWKDNGSFSREIKQYLAYADAGYKIRILSFGEEKYDFSTLHKNITVVFARSGLIPTHLLPVTHREHFQWADVIKTNQTYLSWVFVFASRMYKKPILLRCGFIQGEYLETVSAPFLQKWCYQFFESLGFRYATRVQVPTEKLAEWTIRRYRVLREAVVVLPNFIDVDLFCISENIIKVERSVVTVGRLHAVKRYDLLIRACAKIPGAVLTIVGEGPTRKSLQDLATTLGVNLRLPGSVSNERLPGILCEHQVFVMTSLREGHPKALIEAMGCGLPSVCVKVTGVEDIIRYSKAGLLVGPNPMEISAAILNLLNDSHKREFFGQAASAYARGMYSFVNIFDKELLTLKQLCFSAHGLKNV